MYGEHCLSRQAVRNWIQKYSEGRTNIEDEHRVGRPVEIATPAKNFTRRFPGICEMVG
jgi:transposase-like protein